MPSDFDMAMPDEEGDNSLLKEKETHGPDNLYEIWVAFSRRTKICVAAILVVLELLAIASFVTGAIYGVANPRFPARNIIWDSAAIEVGENGRAELVLRTNLTEAGISHLKNEIVESVCYPEETPCGSVGSSFRFNPCKADDSFVENGYFYDCRKLCRHDYCSNPMVWFFVAFILSVFQVPSVPVVVMYVAKTRSEICQNRYVTAFVIWAYMIAAVYNACTVGFAIFLTYKIGTPVNYVLG